MITLSDYLFKGWWIIRREEVKKNERQYSEDEGKEWNKYPQTRNILVPSR